MKEQAVRIESIYHKKIVAVDSNLGAFVGAEEGAIKSIPGSEGRIAEA